MQIVFFFIMFFVSFCLVVGGGGLGAGLGDAVSSVVVGLGLGDGVRLSVRSGRGGEVGNSNGHGVKRLRTAGDSPRLASNTSVKQAQNRGIGEGRRPHAGMRPTQRHQNKGDCSLNRDPDSAV